MLSRQSQPASMLPSYGLRQRQSQPWGAGPGFDLPPVDLKHEEHFIYKDTDDLASSTSDFVKRLYRYAPPGLSVPHRTQDLAAACSKTSSIPT